MTIEIDGTSGCSDPIIDRLASEAGVSGARAIYAGGAGAAESFTLGSSAAEYGAKILLLALVERELIDPSQISPEYVRMAMNLIEHGSGITDEITHRRLEEEQRRTASIVK